MHFYLNYAMAILNENYTMDSSNGMSYLQNQIQHKNYGELRHCTEILYCVSDSETGPLEESVGLRGSSAIPTSSRRR